MNTAQVGWSASQVANVANETLFSVAERELNRVPGNDEAKARIYGRLFSVKQEIDKFVAEASKDRIVELEAELAQVCEYGERAEQEFQSAKNKELVVRNAENKRIERYNAATKALSNLKDAPLPTFHTNKDVTRKLERIADAQAEVDAALQDMNANPLAIPTVVQAKIAAETKVNTLAAKARGLRHELSALKGEDAHSNTGQQHSFATGLGGLR
jgi:hypothetical protein